VRAQLARLLRHSAVYGLTALASRIASFFLLPLFTRFLAPSDYGRIEMLVALVALLIPLLRAGVATSFFRFYYERDLAPDPTLVVRTAFWFNLLGAVLGTVVGLAFAEQVSRFLFDSSQYASLVRVGFALFFVSMLYDQATSLYRVEERSTEFAIAGLANLAITVTATVWFVVGLGGGATGAMLGNVSGTFVVMCVMIWRQRSALAPAFDRALVRRMNAFGLPLLPAGLALWVVDFADRFFIGHLLGAGAVGVYAVGVKLASAMILVQLAFRTAWPAFAFSIGDDREARAAFAYVLTYIAFIGAWVSAALGLLAPWLVRLVAQPPFYGAERVVAPMSFAGALLTAYTMIAVAITRSNRTGLTWLIAGAGAAANVAINLALIPVVGIMGAALATVGAYAVLVTGSVLWGRAIYPIAYQWRRVATAAIVGVVVCFGGRALHLPLAGALALALGYPAILVPLRFYEPAERRRLLAIAGRIRRA
jgi:O-antigen/teichoic acid export membrane protein